MIISEDDGVTLLIRGRDDSPFWRILPEARELGLRQHLGDGCEGEVSEVACPRDSAPPVPTSVATVIRLIRDRLIEDLRARDPLSSDLDSLIPTLESTPHTSDAKSRSRRGAHPVQVPASPPSEVGCGCDLLGHKLAGPPV